MAARANTVARVVAALVCLVAVMLSLMPCAMSAPVMAGPAHAMAMSATSCRQCCNHDGSTRLHIMKCAMQTQPAEPLAAQNAPEIDNSSFEHPPIALAAWLAPLEPAFVVPPPVLLRPILRI